MSWCPGQLQRPHAERLAREINFVEAGNNKVPVPLDLNIWGFCFLGGQIRMGDLGNSDIG